MPLNKIEPHMLTFEPVLKIVKSTVDRNAMTPVSAGLQVFDSTLNKPIWRNGTNTAWVDATGVVV